MRLKPDARDHRLDLRKRGDGVATPIIFIYILQNREHESDNGYVLINYELQILFKEVWQLSESCGLKLQRLLK